MSNQIKRTIILNKYGREQLEEFFLNQYAIGFPSTFYDSIVVADTLETDFRHVLYRRLLGLLRTDVDSKYIADNLPMRQNYDVVMEILKNYQIITITGESPTTIVTTKHNVAPTVFKSFKEPSEYVAPLEITDGDFNTALNLVMGVLEELVENSSVVFTELYMLRFDRFSRTLVNVTPRIEIIDVTLDDLGTTVVDDDGVG